MWLNHHLPLSLPGDPLAIAPGAARGICPSRRCLRSLRSQGTLVLWVAMFETPKKGAEKVWCVWKAYIFTVILNILEFIFGQTLPFTFFLFVLGGVAVVMGITVVSGCPRLLNGLTWCQLFDVWSLGWCQLIPWIVFEMSWKHQPDPTMIQPVAWYRESMGILSFLAKYHDGFAED